MHKQHSKNKYDIKRALVKEDGSMCYYCDEMFPISELTLDHIYPKSKIFQKKLKGYSKNNSVLSCNRCNERKGNRVICIEDFRKETMGKFYTPKIFVHKSKFEDKIQRNSKVMFAKNVVYPTNPIVKRLNWFERIVFNIKRLINL